jgi:ABC-type amino acid transport substrate-binding protein
MSTPSRLALAPLCAALCIGVPALAAPDSVHAASGPGTSTRWVVGTQLSPPFVTRGEDGRYGGIAISLWQEIAATLGVETEFRAFDYDSAGMMRALERGELDIVVSNLAVDDQVERRIDFTHPYLRAELAIVTRTKPSAGWLATLRSLKLGQVIFALAGLLALLSAVGAVVWAIERRRNADQFDPKPAQGLVDGVWWAAVTMTTTGYGDKAPRSLAGRAVAIVWMFSSIFLTALFSATLASALVVDRLQTRVTGPQDLPKVRVGSVADTAPMQWLNRQGIAAQSYPFVIQALNAVQRGDVDALVYDRVVLSHLLTDQPTRGLVLLGQGVAELDYAFALSQGSPKREAVNRALLEAVNRQPWESLSRRALGRGS